jgi:hypothetical protein
MRQDIADLWAEELRSGKYTQGTGFLCTEKENDTPKHCCLGVLCELAIKQGLPVAIQKDGEVLITVSFDGEAITLPDSVVDWAGLKSSGGKWDEARDFSLWHANDSGTTFDEIAEIIEKEWRHL